MSLLFVLRVIHRLGTLLALAAAIGLLASASLLAKPVGASPSTAPTFTVNRLFDIPADLADTNYTVCRTAANNTNCTLRAAIMKANRVAGGGATIILPAGIYMLEISPAGGDDDRTGDFNITQAVTIQGASATTTIIDGSDLDRLFHIEPGVTAAIQDVTLRNGRVDGGDGGAVLNDGTLTMSGGVVSDSNAKYGGGIASYGRLTLDTIRVESNEVVGNYGFGGGLYLAGNTVINNSAIRGNRADGLGGGLYNSFHTVINNSTVNGNLAGFEGGGIKNWSSGVLTMNNSTVSANSTVGRGGGIDDEYAGLSVPKLYLFHVTIVGNISDSNGLGFALGGGIRSNINTDLWNTLLAENYVGATNTSGNDCYGPTISHDYNYIQVTAGCGLTGTTTHNLSGGEALLGPLANFGGSTLTRALLPGSPALDQIPSGLCRNSFGTAPVPDQRGVARPVNVLCDIGAFEGVYNPGLYYRNLVRNGDAESGGASPTGAYVGTPHWAVSSGTFTAVPYGIGGGFPDPAIDEVPANHGYNFFAGGPSSPSSAAQVIALSALSTNIDAGRVLYTLSADLGGYLGQNDNAFFTAHFLNGAAAEIGPAVTIGPVLAGNRDGTGFMPVSFSGTLPAGTRTIRVVVTMTAAVSYNDGYADNLSLVLTPDLSYLFLPFLRH